MDVRIAELRFLTDLQADPRDVRCATGITGQDTYDLPPHAFRDLVLALLLDGCLNGTASLAWGGQSGYLERDARVVQAFNELVSGQPTRIWINHRGRLRLARLRTELQSNRIRDKFGILLDQRHIDRDLLVAALTIDSERPLSVLLADLDHFKAINDRLTYSDGDLALRRYFSIADRILGSKGDVYCRGGDEVLAILPGVTEPRALELAELLRKGVEEEFSSQPDDRLDDQPTASIGVATSAIRIAGAELQRLATEALHAAKADGKNRVANRRPSGVADG